MKLQLFAASVGQQMVDGVDLGQAILNAAVDHDEQRKLWAEVREPLWDIQHPGEILRDGQSLGVFVRGWDYSPDLVASQEMVKSLMAIAFGNLSDYLTDEGEVITDLSKFTPDQLAAVRCFEVMTDGKGRHTKVAIELHDKIGALKQLAKLSGLTAIPWYRKVWKWLT